MDKKILRVFGLVVFAVGMAVLVNAAEGGRSMKLKSPEFEHNKFIPSKFTCDGADVNPALIIEGLPDETQTLALIVNDIDAPRGTWVHWVVFNIPPADKIGENSVPGKQGINDFGRKNYGGPCPPFGAAHHYFFKIYALDTKLDLEEGISKNDLEEAMDGHIIDQAELVGVYKRGSSSTTKEDRF